MSNKLENQPLLDIIETKGSLDQSPGINAKASVLTADHNIDSDAKKRQKQPSPFLRKSKVANRANERNTGIHKSQQ
jgi:hypothetical protein